MLHSAKRAEIRLSRHNEPEKNPALCAAHVIVVGSPEWKNALTGGWWEGNALEAPQALTAMIRRENPNLRTVHTPGGWIYLTGGLAFSICSHGSRDEWP